MKSKISVFLIAGLASGPVLAGPAGASYAGLHYARATLEGEVPPERLAAGSDAEAEPGLLIGRIGHHATEYLSLEARAGMGVSDDSIEVNDKVTRHAAEIDELYGVYAIGHLPLAERFSLYALVGYSWAEGTVKEKYDDFRLESSDSDADFSYGVGAQVDFSQTVAGTLEYTSYLDNSDYELTAISAGLNFLFW